MTASLLVFTVRFLCGGQPLWKGCVPEARQRIYFANHTSHLDAVLIWAALPPAVRGRTRPVAAADYWRNGAVRRYLADRVFHALLIDRTRVTARKSP